MNLFQNYQERVKEFQLASDQPVNVTYYELTPDEFNFRDDLFREELKELTDAIVDYSLAMNVIERKKARVEILDALADIKYVNDGTANMIGVSQLDADLERDFYMSHYGMTYPTYIETLRNLKCTDVTRINFLVYRLAHLFDFSLSTFTEALSRVHKSNMSKFCIDSKTAERTREFYAEQSIDTILQPKEKITVVFRAKDRKVLKSVEYFPVYLDDLV